MPVGFIPLKIIIDSLMFRSPYRNNVTFNSYADADVFEVREGGNRRVGDVYGGTSEDILQNVNAADVVPPLLVSHFAFQIQYAASGTSTTWTDLPATGDVTFDIDDDGSDETVTLNESNTSVAVYSADLQTARAVNDAVQDTDILAITVPDLGNVDVENLRIQVTITQ